MDLRSLLRALPVALFLAAGCAPSATPPTSPVEFDGVDGLVALARPGSLGRTGIVDLGIGRRTELAFHAVAVIKGTSDPYIVSEYTEAYYVEAAIAVDGVEYRRERSATLTGDGPIPNLSYLRQDRKGLYVRQAYTVPGARAQEPTTDSGEDVVAARRLASRGDIAGLVLLASRGPREHESTVLPYPLRRNKSWEGRYGSVWTVEGLETMQTKAGPIEAWRFSIRWPAIFGRYEYHRVWWGAPGLVRTEARHEIEELDGWDVPTGNVLVWDGRAELLDYDPGS